MGLGIDRRARHPPRHLAGQRVEVTDVVDLVVEQLEPDRLPLGLRREDVDHLAPDAVGAGPQIHLVAGVLHVGQPTQDLALVRLLAAIEMQHHAEVGPRVPEPVDRGHRGDDDRVAPLQQRLRRGQAHLLDVGVDRRVLLYISVGGWDVGLGLVVIVIGDEVLDGVVGEKLPEFAVQLGRQGLVMGQHQGRALDLLDDVGHGEGLARARDPQQRLERQAALEALHETRDRLRLIAGGGVVGHQFEARAHVHSSRIGRP